MRTSPAKLLEDRYMSMYRPESIDANENVYPIRWQYKIVLFESAGHLKTERLL